MLKNIEFLKLKNASWFAFKTQLDILFEQEWEFKIKNSKSRVDFSQKNRRFLLFKNVTFFIVKFKSKLKEKRDSNPKLFLNIVFSNITEIVSKL